MPPLTSIPSDLGQGGANLSDGSPKIAALLEEHRAAIATLQDAPAPESTYLTVCVPDSPGPGAFALSGAVVGRKVKSAICITLANPSFGPVEFSFESTISLNNAIVQTDSSDFTNATLIFLLEGPNPNESP